jgi:hypothetical protein
LGAGILGKPRGFNAIAPHTEGDRDEPSRLRRGKDRLWRGKVANKQIETETHKAALMEFRKQVSEKQSSLQIELGLMSLDGKVEMFS